MIQRSKAGPHLTEAARLAAHVAKAAKRAERDSFGLPELFVVSAEDNTFTWELRRFGGIVLQRGTETFPEATAAGKAGEVALAVLLNHPDLPTIARQGEPK